MLKTTWNAFGKLVGFALQAALAVVAFYGFIFLCIFLVGN